MNRSFSLWLIALLPYLAFATTPPVVLPELWNPKYIVVDDLRLYVSQKETVYIYRLKDFKLTARFGESGEGPQQFVPNPGGTGVLIFPLTDSLFLTTYGKFAYYSKEGKFISEKRVSNNRRFIPFRDKFLSLEEHFDWQKINSEYVLVLYDSHLKKVKELTAHKGFKNFKKKYPADIPIFSVWKDKVAVKGEGEGLVIDIYNDRGTQTGSIRHKVQRRKFTEKDKEEYFEAMKTLPETRKFSNIIKRIVEFRPYFPAIYYFWTANGKIYIMTFKENNGKQELLVFDFNGKFLAQAFLPVGKWMAQRFYPAAVYNERFYQLFENEDTEDWELHIENIK
jgi:hypothetical protein